MRYLGITILLERKYADEHTAIQFLIRSNKTQTLQVAFAYSLISKYATEQRKTLIPVSRWKEPKFDDVMTEAIATAFTSPGFYSKDVSYSKDAIGFLKKIEDSL